MIRFRKKKRKKKEKKKESFCVLESKYIHADRDLLLDISLSVGQL